MDFKKKQMEEQKKLKEAAKLASAKGPMGMFLFIVVFKPFLIINDSILIILFLIKFKILF